MVGIRLRFAGRFCVGLLLGLFALPTTSLRAETNPWQTSVADSTALFTEKWVEPGKLVASDLDYSSIQTIINAAPLENSAKTSEAVILLPLPDGSFERFRFVQVEVMAPELGVKFPEIRTFRGESMDRPAVTVRFDLTPVGFHAQILSPEGTSYIEPYVRGNAKPHVCYFKQDYQNARQFECLTASDDMIPASKFTESLAAASLNGNLRTYRLACAATGEYTAYHGGTVSAGMAAIVTAINRVSGIYETELGIRLVLVANNNLIIYTNSASDPYTDSNPSSLLSQNQSNLDAVIGAGNYDIGHVFGTAGGGMAAVGVVCSSGLKARGETGMYPPTGDGFWVDYVAHEIGHQFGATHTFNSTNSGCSGNRTASTAYETGSGSTIMAYAGVCGSDNLQSHSSPCFHAASFDQIMTFVTSGGGSAGGTTTFTGNHVPVISPGTNYTIPAGTPFSLTASGNDPDGDSLTWSWEQRDLGPAAALAAADNGSSPLFRSFSPTLSSCRTFPQLSDILNNTTTSGERLPTTNRTMNFRATARDNRAGGGGLASADVQVAVTTTAGPFRLTSPATAVAWSGARTVTWNVAGTTNAPITAARVNIFLSTNGGVLFPITLAANVPNNGSQMVVLPNISTTTARIKVQAADNIFFDISRSNFSITPALTPSSIVLALSVSNGLATLSWNSESGKTYQVQYRDSLALPWSIIGPNIVSTSSTTSVAYPVAATAQRFYRVAQVQ